MKIDQSHTHKSFKFYHHLEARASPQSLTYLKSVHFWKAWRTKKTHTPSIYEDTEFPLELPAELRPWKDFELLHALKWSSSKAKFYILYTENNSYLVSEIRAPKVTSLPRTLHSFPHPFSYSSASAFSKA